MPSPRVLVLLFLPFFSLLSINAQSTSCKEGFSFRKMRRNITNCKKLGTLGAEFGWNYDSDTNSRTIDIFFGAKPHAPTGWIAWGVNPHRGPHMVGTRALIGFQHANGSLLLRTYNITRETKIGCRLHPSEIEVKVENQHLVYRQETGFLTMSATLTLPPEYNLLRLNHVWQVGSLVVDVEPQMHAFTLQNFESAEIIDLTSGRCRSAGHHLRHLRIVHGVLNVVGWGTFLPIGVIVTRYLKETPVQYVGWFKLHVSCQILGYSIGTTGWGIGIWLGNASKYYSFSTHRMFGIIIFTFTTLQIFAQFLKPKKEAKYRKYWNIYYDLLGYALIVLIIVNIVKGYHILRPDEKLKWAYVGVLGVLASIVLAFELLVWTKFLLLKHKRQG